MSDGVKSEISSDIENYSFNTADPKNVQELTIYVSRTNPTESIMHLDKFTHELN